MVIEDIPESWRAALEPALANPEARMLVSWLEAEEAAGRVIYPPRDQRLAALALTPLHSVRVLILGQDPYHGPDQAHGLAFSVREGIKTPPSLRNIFKELHSDLGLAHPAHGNLAAWAKQGVLLLNTTLTVQAGQAASHAGRGWEAITDACVQAVAANGQPCVFILWGNHAKKKAGRIHDLGLASHHLVLTSPHPSPLSAYHGFFGSKPFSQTNAFLKAHACAPIDWAL